MNITIKSAPTERILVLTYNGGIEMVEVEVEK